MKTYIEPEMKITALIPNAGLANSFFNWDFNAIANNAALEADGNFDSNLEVPIEETNNPEGNP